MSYYSNERTNALVKTFFDIWDFGWPPCDYMRLAALQPAPRFYATPEWVARKIKARSHGKHAGKRNLTEQMLDEIIRRCDGNTSIDNIALVLEQPAPSFYLRPETARKLIQQELKRRRKCRHRKH